MGRELWLAYQPIFAASVAELRGLLLGTGSVEGFLGELAVLAARTVGDGVSCGYHDAA